MGRIQRRAEGVSYRGEPRGWTVRTSRSEWTLGSDLEKNRWEWPHIHLSAAILCWFLPHRPSTCDNGRLEKKPAWRSLMFAFPSLETLFRCCYVMLRLLLHHESFFRVGIIRSVFATSAPRASLAAPSVFKFFLSRSGAAEALARNALKPGRHGICIYHLPRIFRACLICLFVTFSLKFETPFPYAEKLKRWRFYEKEWRGWAAYMSPWDDARWELLPIFYPWEAERKLFAACVKNNSHSVLAYSLSPNDCSSLHTSSIPR